MFNIGYLNFLKHSKDNENICFIKHILIYLVRIFSDNSVLSENPGIKMTKNSAIRVCRQKSLKTKRLGRGSFGHKYYVG